jgi:hypothetical protein
MMKRGAIPQRRNPHAAVPEERVGKKKIYWVII